MKRLFLFLFSIISTFLVLTAQAEPYQGDGEWAVQQYIKGATLIYALNIYGEDEKVKVIRPTFMINYGNGENCLVSFGLTIFKDDLSPKISNMEEVISVLKSIIEQSDFFADNEILTNPVDKVQALDMGEFLYARTLISYNSLLAFMLAKNGSIRTRDEGNDIVFDMYGFEKTINTILNKYCG